MKHPVYQKKYTSTSPKPKLTSWIPLLANVNAHRKNAPRISFYIFRQQRNLLHCNTCCIISDYHPQNCCLFINLSFPFHMFFTKHALRFHSPPQLDGGWRIKQAQQTVCNTDDFVIMCIVSQAVQHPWGSSKCYLPSIQLVHSMKMSEHEPEEKCLPVLMLKMCMAVPLLPHTSSKQEEHKGQSYDAN